MVHRSLPVGETDFEVLDADQSLRDVLGVAADFEYELLNHEDWVGRRMVAQRLRQGRVFLAGDAAHLWVPFAGYGMNAGIADGMNLAWLLAAVLEGWGDPAMLDAYEAERHPITEQVSRLAMQNMLDMLETLGRNPVPEALSARLNPVGMAMRKFMGGKLHDLNVPQFAPEGLNFGYFYSASPIICYDDEQAPGYSMGIVVSSSVPGCRAPHLWLEDGRSLYDELGCGYTLLRFKPEVDVLNLTREAIACGIPLKVLDIPQLAVTDEAIYRHALVIVRQDQHVVWRGNKLPESVSDLLSLLSGKSAVANPSEEKIAEVSSLS